MSAVSLRRFGFCSLVVALSACATTGATLGSGVGDAMLSQPPWYAGARTTPTSRPDVPVGALPIMYQTRDGRGEIFDPQGAPGSAIATLLEEMNAFLPSLTASNAVPLRLLSGASVGTPPDVRFGCLTEGNLPGEECVARGDSVLGRIPNLNQMKLEVGRPSPEWTASASAEAAKHGVDYTLVIALEVGEYVIRQTGMAGNKSVDLGSNHVQSLPWLTSLEQPVQVLQLTGALVGRDGKAIRIGAEGVIAKRTPIVASGFGVSALISDADVELLRTRRREDLPGNPLAWQEALRELVRGLTR